MGVGGGRFLGVQLINSRLDGGGCDITRRNVGDFAGGIITSHGHDDASATMHTRNRCTWHGSPGCATYAVGGQYEAAATGTAGNVAFAVRVAGSRLAVDLRLDRAGNTVQISLPIATP